MIYLIILLLTSCTTLLEETVLVEKVLHDVEIAERNIETDIEEPPGCNTKVSNG